MAKIEKSVVIDRPVEDVWQFITYVPNFTKWDKGVIEARQTSTGPFGVGATFEAKTQEFGLLKMRVVQYEPNQRYAYQFMSAPHQRGSTTTFAMEAIEVKSRLTLTFDLRIVGIYKLLGPFIVRRMRRSERDSLDNLKRILESEAKP